VASVAPVEVPCPACGDSISVPITLTTGEAHDGRLPVTLAPDLSPVSDHVEQHAHDAPEVVVHVTGCVDLDRDQLRQIVRDEMLRATRVGELRYRI